ncbi:hypothetical protein GW17_00037332 [Ensete ventricosum]|nr:hypothetical protein GW17_00037332 [Ensete ventricosum]
MPQWADGCCARKRLPCRLASSLKGVPLWALPLQAPAMPVGGSACWQQPWSWAAAPAGGCPLVGGCPCRRPWSCVATLAGPLATADRPCRGPGRG